MVGNTDTEGESKAQKSIFQRVKSFEGIQLCATVACIALAINTVLAAIAFARGYSQSTHSGFVTVLLYEGKCSKTKNWSTGLHLLINALGTVILGSSNYCAQFLAAPTREDVNRAHARGSWLDIGVPSVRNIRALGAKRKAIWAILMLSTVPIHAFYNSVVLNAESSNGYDVFIAPADYNGSNPLDPTKVAAQCIESHVNGSLAKFNSAVAYGDFEVLTTEQCLNKFAVDFLTGEQTVVVLSNNLTWDVQYPIRFTGQGNSPSSYNNDLITVDSPILWMCSGDYRTSCRKSSIQSQLPSWQVAETRWEGPKWAITFPTDNGSTTITEKESNHECSPSSTGCEDLNHLQNLAWGDVPPTAQLFQKYLDISNWENKTWAQEVTFQDRGSQCFDSRIEGDMDPAGGSLDIFSGRFTVQGCVSAKTEQHCQLLFVPSFSLVVILCTAVKVACIVFLARQERVRRILTVGDAISSFLSNPDPLTQGKGLISKAEWTRPRISMRGIKNHHNYVAVSQQKISGAKRRWWEAGAVEQWLATLVLSFGCLSVAAFLLHRGLQDTRLADMGGTSMSTLWQYGLGSATPYTIIYRVQSSILGNVLLANLPQLLISLSYYFYNSILTTMIMASEYDSYAVRGRREASIAEILPTFPKKGLRVSSDCRGAQRSFYFLSLPYRYSLPLMLAYTILHWLVSQSIFYVRVVMYNSNMEHESRYDVNACGWSPVAFIFAIIVGGSMILVLLGLALRPFRSFIPLAGSCSMAISAACHPPTEDVDAALNPVIWGEIGELTSSKLQSTSSTSVTPLVRSGNVEEISLQSLDGKPGNDVMGHEARHCSFTSFGVSRPEIGQTYT